jgi:cytochrome c-type biogenesis protein CcsB
MNVMLVLLLTLTACLYAVAAAWYHRHMGDDDERGLHGPLLAALGVHAATMVLYGVAHGTTIPRNLLESLSVIAWALGAVYLLTTRRRSLPALGVYIGLIAAMALAACAVLVTPGMPRGHGSFNSPWMWVHIFSLLLSYGSFVLAFGAAVAYLAQVRLLKRKSFSAVQHMPPLETLDLLAYRLIALGFPLLSLGIITGALWAQTAWGSYWNWDPKETWSLITWLVYAAYLHTRVIQGWHGKWSNRLLIAGFACMLVTYVGILLFGHSLHGVK